ncbi:MAG: peptide MFS transporter [Flavobacteriales bacterium]|nr:peptide MFS transporter [Flavobacteriales bacterium]
MTQMQKQETILGHPKGLFILFFTEMWERFSYYGMRAILVLYIVSSPTGANPGLGWTNAESLSLYGWYTMLVYVMSIPGGILADRLLGQKKAVMVGGLLLCAGHGILAITSLWAFYTGLALIILGVGALKPNISTMVGGLYPAGDIRRDKGFTIFYIGINIGAFLSSLIVGYVGEKIGWHYGFGLAGIGMLLGQVVYMWGQKYLTTVGNYIPTAKVEGTNKSVPLTKIEKDRMIVMLLSFLIIIVFWGAFEQAGGLMNLYAKEKINRVILGWEIPASVFQSVNAFFIITCGTAVAAFWAGRRLKNKEESAIFKMALGTMIMGSGFFLMTAASMDAAEPYSKAGLYWLIGAYFLHTIGELCASPVALSFITKLAPVKYASIMMGVYFAATGLGNKLAGSLGEAAQSEPVKVELIAEKPALQPFVADSVINKDDDFSIRSTVYLTENNEIHMIGMESQQDVRGLLKMDDKNREHLAEILNTEGATQEKPYHATVRLSKDPDKKKVEENKGDGKDYSGQIIVEEVQTKAEFNIFTFIALLTIGFGGLLLLFLKKLKRLTHGAEDITDSHHEEQEGFEIADKENT